MNQKHVDNKLNLFQFSKIERQSLQKSCLSKMTGQKEALISLIISLEVNHAKK